MERQPHGAPGLTGAFVTNAFYRDITRLYRVAMTLEKFNQREDALFDFSGGSYTVQRETYMHTRARMFYC